jgi:TonB-dependent SusC/RagA subfamily outer membrane receptor
MYKNYTIFFCDQIPRQNIIRYLVVMKVFFLFFFLSFNVGATTYAQKFSLNKKNIAINDVFKEIRKQTGYNVLIDANLLDRIEPLNVKIKDANINETLEIITQNKGLAYSIIEKNIIVSKSQALPIVEVEQQNFTIEGRVLDVNNIGISGASITVKGLSSQGAFTNEEGYFKVQVPKGSILTISYIGFQSQEIEVLNENRLTITLNEEISDLEEVVVTALGIRREEKALGYSVQKVKGELLQNVKGVDIGTTLTGRVAGLQVLNSTEFNQTPTMTLRGATPLLVIDGVPYGNLSLRDISSDDIESMDILKGATAAALYGARGSNGAIIITTKRGTKEKGFAVSVNSNTMVSSGFLALPEVQTSYSSGYNSRYNTDDYVWGDKLDIGRVYEQWDPELKAMREMELTSRGKDNFKNFLEFSYISNNNVSLSQQGENGSFRASLTNIYNKGQYPNAKLNMTTFSVGGDIKVNNRFTLDANMSFNRRATPNVNGTGYNDQGYIYNILVWTGPEYDLSKYKDYWLVPDESQNWHYNAWYDNPYLIAHEKLMGQNRSVFNTSLSATYNISSWAKVLFRTGYDDYSEKRDQQNPMGIYGTRGGWSGFHSKGKYWVQSRDGFSTNNDLILTTDNSIGDFKVEGLLGGTIYYYEDHTLTSGTNNGLSIPGFYS